MIWFKSAALELLLIDLNFLLFCALFRTISTVNVVCKGLIVCRLFGNLTESWDEGILRALIGIWKFAILGKGQLVAAVIGEGLSAAIFSLTTGRTLTLVTFSISSHGTDEARALRVL